MDSKKNILAVFSQHPLPEFAGDRQMANNHIKNLSKHYAVHAIVICLEKPTVEVSAFLKQYTKSYKIFHISKVEMFFNITRGFLKGEALQVSLFYNAKIQSYIDKALIGKEFVFCCNIRTAKYFLYKSIPKFIDLIDSISINYERSLPNVKSFFWKAIYLYEYKRLRESERRTINAFDATFLVNYNEHFFWANEYPSKRIVWLPNGIKNKLFSYQKLEPDYTNKSIVFLGKMDYQPNVDAVLWFMDNVFPKLDTDIKFFVIGAKPTKKILAKAESNKNIFVLGYVEDPYVIMDLCTLVVSPMQTGGGVQNKILEGMALAKINVATSLGADSIYLAERGKHILVEDDPSQMAALINAICYNPVEYEYIGLAAKELVKDIYTWDNHGGKMIDTIEGQLTRIGLKESITK